MLAKLGEKLLSGFYLLTADRTKLQEVWVDDLLALLNKSIFKILKQRGEGLPQLCVYHVTEEASKVLVTDLPRSHRGQGSVSL